MVGPIPCLPTCVAQNSLAHDLSFFLFCWYILPDQYHVFQRGSFTWSRLPCKLEYALLTFWPFLCFSLLPGAYFSSEVIPDKLAVISLNTLYWYDNNKAVDGCKCVTLPSFLLCAMLQLSRLDCDLVSILTLIIGLCFLLATLYSGSVLLNQERSRWIG
jgi:hypothetical protein